MYPTPDEVAVLETAEAFMVKTMARYDPSHDALHGEFVKWAKESPQYPHPVSSTPDIQSNAFEKLH